MADSDSDSDFEYQLQKPRYVQNVLKPLTNEELVQPTDEWPCYFLENAQVFDKHGALVNLLEVGHRGPFVVKGRLSFEKDDTEVSRCRLALALSSIYLPLLIAAIQRNSGRSNELAWLTHRRSDQQPHHQCRSYHC